MVAPFFKANKKAHFSSSQKRAKMIINCTSKSL